MHGMLSWVLRWFGRAKELNKLTVTLSFPIAKADGCVSEIITQFLVNSLYIKLNVIYMYFPKGFSPTMYFTQPSVIAFSVLFILHHCFIYIYRQTYSRDRLQTRTFVTVRVGVWVLIQNRSESFSAPSYSTNWGLFNPRLHVSHRYSTLHL